MLNIKKNVLTILCMFFLIVVGLKLSPIMVSLFLPFNLAVPQVERNKEKLMSKVNAIAGKCCIDSTASNTFLWKSMKISGWAFLDNDVLDDNNKEKFSLLLVHNNSQNIYSIPAYASNRSDVYRVFQSTHSIRGNLHGVTSEFTSVPLEQGTYRLFIKIQNRGEAVSVLSTTQAFQKKGKDFFQIPLSSAERAPLFLSKPTDGLHVSASNNSEIKFNIDSFSLTGNYVIIRGWAFKNNEDSTKNKILLKMKDTKQKSIIYSTEQVLRPDVGTHFKNKLYNASGFHAVLPQELLGENEASFSIIIQSPGIEAQKPFFLKFNEKRDSLDLRQ